MLFSLNNQKPENISPAFFMRAYICRFHTILPGKQAVIL